MYSHAQTLNQEKECRIDETLSFFISTFEKKGSQLQAPAAEPTSVLCLFLKAKSPLFNILIIIIIIRQYLFQRRGD
jgi:hypothetical protein